MNPPVDRRTFVRASTMAAGALALPGILRANPRKPRDQKLKVALIGVGGMGEAAVEAMAAEHIVAFCDVDEERAAKMYERYPQVPRFNDFRRMLDKMSGQIEGVIISTPDHMHYPAAMAALALDKHIYCQKPLTHTIKEARELARVAKGKKVVTQMGNQGHSFEGCRLLKEWIQGGILGEVREVVSWTDRPADYWPPVKEPPDHSKLIPVAPATLNWDAWLGVAPDRPYDPAYLPGVWRGWWDFGTGPLGDVGCHIMDGAYWALELGAPTSLEAMASGVNEVGTPAATVITMQFPKRGRMPPVKYTWSDGGIKPALPEQLELGRKLSDEAGTLVFGSKATVLADFYYESVRIIPEARMRELAPKLPAKTIPRVEGGPFAEWVRGCKGGPKPGSSFDYAGPFTEMVLLGNVASRVGRRIEWDAAALKITNLPDANRFLTKEYRPGWL